MSGLTSNLRAKLIEEVGATLAGSLTQKWSDLGEQQAEVARVISRILARHDDLVAGKVLLDVISGKAHSKELMPILAKWAEDHVKARAFLEGIKDAQDSLEELKGKIQKWEMASFEEHDERLRYFELKEAVSGASSKAELDTAIKDWLKNGGKIFAEFEALHAFLGKGQLGADDLIKLVCKVVDQKAQGGKVAALLSAFRAMVQDKDPIEFLNILLANSRMSDAVKSAVTASINNGRVTSTEVWEIALVWAGTRGDERIPEILGILKDKKDYGRRLAAWFVAQHQEDLEDLFDLVSEDAWLGLAGLLVSFTQAGLRPLLIERLKGAKILEKAEERLARILAEKGLAQSGKVSKAIIELATGARRLFAESPEADAPELETPEEVALWRDVREVIIAAQLFLTTDSPIDVDSTGTPHLVIGARIRYHTPLRNLVPEGDTQEATLLARKKFCNTLTRFLDHHFRTRLVPTFEEDGVLVISVTSMEPQNGNLSGCDVIYSKVEDRFTWASA